MEEVCDDGSKGKSCTMVYLSKVTDKCLENILQLFMNFFRGQGFANEIFLLSFRSYAFPL